MFFSLLIILTVIIIFSAAATCSFCGFSVNLGDEGIGDNIDRDDTDQETAADSGGSVQGSSSSGGQDTGNSSNSDNQDGSDQDSSQGQQERDDPEDTDEDSQSGEQAEGDEMDNSAENADERELKEWDLPIVASETGSISYDLDSDEVNFFRAGEVEFGYSSGTVWGYETESGESTPSYMAHSTSSGFISFDITPLAGSQIEDAVLSLSSPTIKGDPSYFDNIYINIINWGTGPPPLNMFTAEGTIVQGFPIGSGGNIMCNNNILKTGLQQAVDNNNPRFQLRLFFAGYFSMEDDVVDTWTYNTNNIRLNVRFR